ncbi:IspD/TarI family cytidylyltransferase [Buchananella felis]|uniref:IspD/TarI family cytidylyltransferase n=1 Tax=Buchananella felis TaxID=3231492 RepID=UPI0035273E05
MTDVQPQAWAVLTAAGSGTRLGANLPKAMVEVAGAPMLAHALSGLLASGVVERVVVTAPDQWLGQFTEVARAAAALAGPRAPGGAGEAERVRVVPGGATRQASVAAGLAELARWAAQPGTEPAAAPAATPGGAPAQGQKADVGHQQIVLVHDAARCLTPPALIARVAQAVAAGHGAVVPGLPVTDTIKEVGGQGSVVQVTATPPRAQLRAVQTPQGFTWDVLTRAHAAGTGRAGNEQDAASDDAALAEAIGEVVAVVPGESAALKITTPLDLYLAEKLAADAAGN